jgi:sn-glycerol 3-phosphate transport system ATP-binding protein
MSKTEIDERVRTTAKTLEIDALLTRRPRELSGGQRQRVAMGRAIVRKPKAFLFDEPLSNLDAKLRVSMRVEIRKLQRNLGTTSIYVTHDQLEAMTLADMLVVMNAGLIEQIGAPLAIYEKPATTFVASFIGAPPMNLLPLTRDDAGKLAGDGALGVPAEGAILGVRPEDLILADGARPNDGIALDLTVGAVERVGAETFVYGAFRHEGDVIVRVPGKAAPVFGQKITAIAPRDKLHLFSADGRRRISD